MEPLSDRELDELLREWRPPAPPETLKQRVYAGRRGGWWKWLFTGSIRVPVPLTLAVAALFIVLLIVAVLRGPEGDVVRQTGASGFRPVKRLEVRIIRSHYENGN